ncbi:hypothetical protein IL54_3955 [Sphingobium sp. ba1]|nr:hypothetical protein IL54_3955 [Sphingobium sp. ba1]
MPPATRFARNGAPCRTNAPPNAADDATRIKPVAATGSGHRPAATPQKSKADTTAPIVQASSGHPCLASNSPIAAITASAGQAQSHGSVCPVAKARCSPASKIARPGSHRIRTRFSAAIMGGFP